MHAGEQPFLPDSCHKEMHNFLRFYMNDALWLPLASFGITLNINTFIIQPVLCKKISDMNFMHSYCNKSGRRTGNSKPVFPALFNSSRRVNSLFTRTEQVML